MVRRTPVTRREHREPTRRKHPRTAVERRDHGVAIRNRKRASRQEVALHVYYYQRIAGANADIPRAFGSSQLDGPIRMRRAIAEQAYSTRRNMSASHPPVLFALSESHALGAAIARAARLELAPLEERSFEEGEFKLRPLVSVRDRTVFVVQSLAASAGAPVAQRLLRLLFLLFVLHDAGAARTIAFVPYLAFARKDRRTQVRDPVNARYVAQLLEATGMARLVALDVHNSAALDNAFRIPVDHLSALPMFVDHFAVHDSATAPLVVASPDIGGVKRVQIFRELLERRLGHEAIVLDDLCASGGTLTHAATALRQAGARGVHVAFTHAPLAKGLLALTGCEAISQIVTTDSVGRDLHERLPSCPGRITVLPIGPLFGQALVRMLRGAPLASLLESWPPADEA
jgi:ribose-phosphate pyrophosphokinase